MEEGLGIFNILIPAASYGAHSGGALLGGGMLLQTQHVQEVVVGSASDGGFVLVHRSGRGYLGLLFNNCLFLFGFCLHA